MDQINQSVDILIQHENNDNNFDQNQLIELPQLKFISKRPLYSIQQRNISSIREYFKEKNWLLLSTYATMNTMHLCSRIEFEEKVSNFFIQTKAFRIIEKYSNMNQDDQQSFFNHINQKICSKLFNLLIHHRLSQEQYTYMLSTNKHDTNQINSIIFLPDIRMETVPIRPMIFNASEPITYISQYLYQYLHLSYCLIANSTTFNNGIDVVQALEKFNEKGLLTPMTHFATLDIRDFDITFSHKKIIQTLKLFLRDYVPCQSSRITMSILSYKTIIKLVRLVLKMQYFIYDNKIYQQRRGSNPDSTLIKLLVNIYLFYWEQNLRENLLRKKQLFGRCYNKIFVTWNGSMQQFHRFFHRIKLIAFNFPIKVTIGKSIRYLDVEIIQNNGKLRTKLYQPGLIEHYTLPYLNKYPLDQYATKISRHFIHTIKLCTDVEDFYDEVLFVYSMLLLNHFPLNFIQHCVHNFFHEFNSSKSIYEYNQKTYEDLRQSTIINNTFKHHIDL